MGSGFTARLPKHGRCQDLMKAQSTKMIKSGHIPHKYNFFIDNRKESPSIVQPLKHLSKTHTQESPGLGGSLNIRRGLIYNELFMKENILRQQLYKFIRARIEPKKKLNTRKSVTQFHKTLSLNVTLTQPIKYRSKLSKAINKHPRNQKVPHNNQ